MKRHSVRTLVFLFLLAFTHALVSAPPAFAEKAVGEVLRYIIEGNQPTQSTADNDERLIPIYLIYEERNYTPIWVRDTGPKTKARDFLKILKKSAQHALIPSDYRVAEIEKRINATDFQKLAELELLLSRALLDFGRDLKAGRVEPSKVNSDIHIYPKSDAPDALLDRVAFADKVGPVIAKIQPQTPHYDRLIVALGTYRNIAAKGGWSKIPKGETLKPGMVTDRVPALRKLMIQMGDLKGEAAAKSGADDPKAYDALLVTAVKRFQYRHGIDQDGAIGPDTLAQMNTPISTRIKQLELNMERRRWMQDDFGKFYIFVNLADQFLKVVKQVDGREKTIHTAPLVVGKAFHATPVFSKIMTHMVLNPYWNIPSSIARNEMLPKLRRNPGALQRQNIRIFSGWGKNATEIDPFSIDWNNMPAKRLRFRMRQEAGAKNALGRIKFMFPNKFNVYIHDTPSKSLFARTSRFYSHGCMRVKDPQTLAAVLLRERSSGWNRKKIVHEIATSKRRVVRIKSPVPVHVTYLTAWVNKDMSVHFRKDVYGRDKKLARAIQRSRLASTL